MLVELVMREQRVLKFVMDVDKQGPLALLPGDKGRTAAKLHLHPD